MSRREIHEWYLHGDSEHFLCRHCGATGNLNMIEQVSQQPCIWQGNTNEGDGIELDSRSQERTKMTYLDTNWSHVKRIDIKNNSQQIDVCLESGKAHIEFIENEDEVIQQMTIPEAKKYVSALNEAIRAAKNAVKEQYKNSTIEDGT